ncbi:MAG: YqeG family HAD IIIA-type phosphatase [Clostridia bacterium]|nr:YqeG family HAD IIIA-type phosphatase [Clostridia bacterium]
MMLGFFRPDMAFCDVYTITPEALNELGIKGIIFDIDNTIAPYEVECPTERMKDYFVSLREAGIKMAFVSNNKDARVSRFNECLGLYYVCKAGKPSPKGVKKCIAHFGLSNDEVIAVGDQIFTDCIAAHRAGIKCALVKPIQPVESLFFRIKRYLERPFVRGLDWMTAKDAIMKLRMRKNKIKGK